jgi:hypothetical protein
MCLCARTVVHASASTFAPAALEAGLTRVVCGQSDLEEDVKREDVTPQSSPSVWSGGSLAGRPVESVRGDKFLRIDSFLRVWHLV